VPYPLFILEDPDRMPDETLDAAASDAKAERILHRRLDRLEQQLPGFLRDWVAHLRHPSASWIRVPLGILFIAGGLVGFLPVLGFWMVPLGLILLALDVALLRRPTAHMIVGGERLWVRVRRRWRGEEEPASQTLAADAPTLPEPYATPSVVNFPIVVGWPEGRTPKAPDGFEVTLWADGLDYPRWFHVLPNGDVLVAEARTVPRPGEDENAPEAEGMRRSRALGRSANRITLFRDADGDGRPEIRETFLSGLSQPFGMALLGDRRYVANTDGVLVFPYEAGQTRIAAQGRKILDLPAGGYNNHWTRNIVAGRDGRKLYVTVGSASNIGEYGMDEEHHRACILEIDPDGGNERLYASGLRNPVGLDFEPATGTMWTAVNERDELGDELVPDYVTSVQEGGFYGWPWAYFGRIEDPRLKGRRPDLVARSLAPDLAVGSHTASLGLVFYTGTAFPERYRGGAFIGQHGSWNRTQLSGYKVAFVPFAHGRPSGPMEDFLTGFVADDDRSLVYGRPCGVTMLPDGSLLVADDAGDRIWRVGTLG
jgi:glucose/arabinose dehydrogenase